MILPWLGLVALAGGYRLDQGHAPDVALAAPWAEPTWTAPLGAGNASPVPFAGGLLITVEPTSLALVDAETGAVRWSIPHEVVDTLPPEEAERVRGQLAGVEALEAAEAEAKRAYSRALRDARRGDGAVSEEALSTLRQGLTDLRARIDALAPYRTPPTYDDVGWASPTPVTDGERACAVFANGVVGCHDAGGRTAWRRWLGPPIPNKEGHEGTDAASPLLVDGVLVVPYRTLQALDPATGETLWEGPRYPHYGTPAVARVGGDTWLVTPGGRALALDDGRVVLEGLPKLKYNGPVTDGDRVYAIGSSADYNEVAPNDATAWRLHGGATPRAEKLWSASVETKDRVYGVPALDEARVYVVTSHGTLIVLDRAEGTVVAEHSVADRFGEIWAGPLVARDALWFASIEGDSYAVGLQPPFAPLATWRVDGAPTVPSLSDGAAWWRGGTGLYRYDLRTPGGD